jgi:hypothetical protein
MNFSEQKIKKIVFNCLKHLNFCKTDFYNILNMTTEKILKFNFLL